MIILLVMLTDKETIGDNSFVTYRYLTSVFE